MLSVRLPVNTKLLVVKSGGSQVMCGFLTVWVWKKVKVKVVQLCLTLCDSMDCSPWNSPGQNAGWVAFPFSRGSSQPRSPTLQVVSLPVEQQGKSKNTGVGSLSLLQRIFLTQELNQGLLLCRRILYQLSSLESPVGGVSTSNSSRCSKVNSVCYSNSF